jgi:protochlorophyllide reductase
MRVIMTGASAGIGLEAFKHIAANHEVHSLVGIRNKAQVPDFVRDHAQLADLDLADLHSVRRFCAEVLVGPPIDRLVLNAGIQLNRPATSADGFELTFAVNHLAHFVIVQSLMHAMAPNGRIVLTSSGTHDPAEKTPIPVPRHADARRLAFPVQDKDLDANPGTATRRAYSASKLCNILTARALTQKLADDRPDVMIAAFDPGFTPGTSLARNYPAPLAFAFRHLLPLLIRLSGQRGRTSTPANSGRLLAELVLSDAYQHARGDYFAVRGPDLEKRDPSVLARDMPLAIKLWDDSAALVSL